MAFNHLNIQSGYSLMKSTIKIEPLVKRAKELGYQSLALTDEEVMSGSVAFYQVCKQYGLKPIIGLKTIIRVDNGSFPTLLLARNHQGYQNLMKISSWVQTQTESLDLQQISHYSDDLIVIIITSETPWVDSLLNQRFEEVDHELQSWHQVFTPSGVYVSIQDRDLHMERQLHKPLKEWSESSNIQVVAISDVKYLHKEDAVAYHTLKAMEEGRRLSPELEEIDDQQYLKTPDQMEAFFKEWWPEVVHTTEEIVNKCHLEIRLDRQLIPSYPTPDGKGASQYLRELCYSALDSKYIHMKTKAQERLDHELDIITSMEFSNYFLIVWDFISYARKQGIQAGPGRGSAAGSIVAFLLDITLVDPLEYNLLFERFLNPERITMPDIDIDFPDHRRDEVIEYVAEKYGKHHVAQICTFGTFAARSVLRELFKTMAVDESDAAFILKQIPRSASTSLVEIVQESEPLKDYIRNSEQLKRLFKVAVKLEGLPRHISTHAAGVVISEDPLMQHTALMDNQGGVYLTQLAMGELESIGLLKIDFLGLRNLTFIERVAKKIKRYEDDQFTVEEVPMNDPATFSLLKQGRTNGVFQLESKGMKSVLKRLKPNHFEDVVAVNALYRPGPMEYIQTYIDRKNDTEKVQYPHTDIIPILEPTYGVLVYQEQIMQVAQIIAGYSLGEADLLRRAVSKKQASVLKEQREQFVAGSLSRGYSEHVAHQLFDWIVKFSNYGFNRSHAVAYSFISYRLAYMKAHYPSFFLAELINAHMGDHDKLATYIREARDSKVSVHPPSINRSQMMTQDENGAIRMGLVAIKGVGYQAAQVIVEERKNGYFRHLHDFCMRVVSRTVNRHVLESLILAGAFDEVQENRASLLASIDQALEQGELFKEFQGQPGLFENDLDVGEAMIDAEPFPVLKKLALEKEVLGTYLSEHPLEFHRRELRGKGIVSLHQAFTLGQRRLETAAVIESIKEIRTKRGDPMAFVTISDETIDMDGVLFPEVYRKAKPWLEEQMLIHIHGKVEDRRGRKQMIISQLSPFQMEGLEEEPGRRLFIKVSKAEEHKAIEKLREVSGYFPGNIPILIFRSDDRKAYQLDADYSMNPSRECLNRLNEFFGDESVALRAYKSPTKE